MDLNEDLRKKRLNYYTKILSASTTKIDLENHKLAQNKPPLNSSTNKQDDVRLSQQSSSSSTTFGQKNEFLDKIFGGGEMSRAAKTSTLKFNQSLSFDESTTSSVADFQAVSLPSSSSSRRFEEFKRVVESSYEQHVLNKLNHLSLDVKNPTTTTTAAFPELDLTSSSRRIDSGSTNSRIEIPYMSAYNIYKNDDESASSARVNINLDIKSLPKVPIAGSNGSSLNTSPTSMSSGESNNLHVVSARQGEVLIKPPLTPKPKSGAPAFRNKNILRMSSNSSYSKSVPPPVELEVADSLDLPKKLPGEAESDLNASFAPANNIFKQAANNETTDSSDSGSDTFDIFSSRESLRNDNQIPKKDSDSPKRVNLSIDLSGIRSDDEEEARQQNRDNHNEPMCELNDDNFIRSKRNSTSSIQQVKPDIIPNLALDQFDDDKSQSVTVSLAKSMCKEIDYKKEMEAIVGHDGSLPKSARLKPINLELLRKKRAKPSSGPSLNLASSIKQETKPKSMKLEPATRSYFLRPLSSENTPRVDGKFNPRPNSSSVLPTRAAKLNPANSTSSIQLPGVDKSNKNGSEMVKNYARKSVSYLKSKDANLAAESRHWESAHVRRTPLVRSSSAQLVRETKKSGDKPPAPLFLNYSKLIAIEASLEQDKILNQQSSVDSDDITEVPANENENDGAKPDDGPMNEREESRWLQLPDELWLKILSHLKQSELIQVGRTCKKLSQLYTDSSLWRKITLKYKYEMRDEWLHWIGKRRPNELNIIQCSGNLSLMAISEMFRNIGDQLTSLNLSRCSNGSLSGDNFALQASIRCPNVTDLDLSWTLLSNQTLKLIVDSFKRIETINLSGCNMIQEDGFNSLLVKHGESIKQLEISGCIHFSSNCLINIGVYCRGIERLNISNCHRMTNESLMESCQHWPRLKHIDFRGIKNIKNNCVSLMVRKCPSIESIALGECVNIGDTSILEIATYKPHIKYLDANSCKKLTDNSLRSLASFCGKLQHLNIRATNVTDIGLLSLSNGKCAANLEEVNLSYLPIKENVLLKLIRNCKRLKKVHLYGCFNVKNIEAIRQTCSDRPIPIELCI